jgi:uncharacterized protein YndB with AHSA1/START domain
MVKIFGERYRVIMSKSTLLKVYFTPCAAMLQKLSLFNEQRYTRMKTGDFTTTLLVDQSPARVFEAINNVRGWWSEDVEGGTEKLNDEFKYRYKDVHVCRMKLVEVVTNRKVVWHVLENHFNFTEDKTEWTGTKVCFEISEANNQTQLKFTHEGLVPAYECFEICREGWTNYINGSLFNLITKGKGQPNPREGGFNQQLADEYAKNKQL